MPSGYQFIRFFRDIGLNDVPLVGGKNASLGELYRELAPMASVSRMGLPSPQRDTGRRCNTPVSGRACTPLSNPLILATSPIWPSVRIRHGNSFTTLPSPKS